MSADTDNWPVLEADALREHWRCGHTASYIAAALNARFGNGRSRNAVIGKARRLRLANRGPRRAVRSPRVEPSPGPLAKRTVASPKREIIQNWKPAKAKPAQSRLNKVEEAPSPSIARSLGVQQSAEAFHSSAPSEQFHFHVDGPHTAPVTLMMRSSRQCAWPVNGGMPLLVCGAPIALGSSYCAYHTIVATPAKARVLLRGKHVHKADA